MNFNTIALPFVATTVAVGAGIALSGEVEDDGLELAEAAGTGALALGLGSLFAMVPASLGAKLALGLGTASVVIGASLGANLIDN